MNLGSRVVGNSRDHIFLLAQSCVLMANIVPRLGMVFSGEDTRSCARTGLECVYDARRQVLRSRGDIPSVYGCCTKRDRGGARDDSLGVEKLLSGASDFRTDGVEAFGWPVRLWITSSARCGFRTPNAFVQMSQQKTPAGREKLQAVL